MTYNRLTSHVGDVWRGEVCCAWCDLKRVYVNLFLGKCCRSGKGLHFWKLQIIQCYLYSS